MLGFPRREFPMKFAFTTAVAAGCLFAVTAYAQQDFSKVEIKTTPLGNNVYMLEGQGGNVVAAVGQDAVIQVDGEFAPLHDKIKAAIDRVSGGKPIRYLVNTHFHGDHTDGNDNFAKYGAVIVSQENLRKRMAGGAINAQGAPVSSRAPASLPSITYADSMTLR